MKAVKQKITSANDFLNIKDPRGLELLAQADIFISEELDKARKNDIPVNLLYDPSSEHYLYPKVVLEFNRTPEQKLKDLVPPFSGVKSDDDDNDDGGGDDTVDRVKSLIKNWLNKL